MSLQSGERLNLFFCAVRPPQEAVRHWRAELAHLPLDDFDFSAQRMLPAIYKNLKSLGEDIPEQGRMRGLTRYYWVKNAQLCKACADVLEIFEDSDIACLVLKGVYLAGSVHQDLGVRPATDFDLLVRPNEAQRAIDVLLSHDWRIKGAWCAPTDRLENSVTLEKEGAELDLHWALLREARRPEHDHVLWEKAVPCEIGTRSARTLCPTHQLFHLLALADREPQNLVRYLYDIHRLREHHHDEFDLEEVHRMLSERHILSRLTRLPLRELGWEEWIPQSGPGLFDRLWGGCTRFLHHQAQGEWNYALFPFLDYLIHYRGASEPGWSWWTYLGRRLEVKGPRDLLSRSLAKLRRMLKRTPSWKFQEKVHGEK